MRVFAVGTRTHLRESLSAVIRHRPGRKTIVTPMTGGVAPVTMLADPAPLKALARAFP